MNDNTYSVKAGVDWIELTLKMSRMTRFDKLQRIICESLNFPNDSKIWVKPQNPCESNAATVFAVRFQAHTFPKAQIAFSPIQSALDAIAKEIPFDQAPTVSAIEVSLDFKPKGGSDVTCAEILLRLAGRHFAEGNNPRQYNSDSKKTPTLQQRGMRLQGDGTYYLGNRKDSVCWKAYVKKTDQRNKDEMANLPQSEWKTRIEVTLQHHAPIDFKLHTLTQLANFHFETLTKDLFNFRMERNVSEMAGSPFTDMVISKQRSISDATEGRGVHSFTALSPKDKRGRVRKLPKHTKRDDRLCRIADSSLRKLTGHWRKGFPKAANVTSLWGTW